MDKDEAQNRFDKIMQAAIDLRDVLQADLKAEADWMYVASVETYLTWILDDLIDIFFLAKVSSFNRAQNMIKAMRMLLCVLEETNRHAKIAKPIVEAVMRDEEDEDEPLA